MQEATTTPRYKGYWIAWFGLLAITFLMVTSDHPGLQIAGILVKAAVIALFFMHLRSERFDLGLLIAISILGSALLLFGLIAADGMAS